MQLLAKFKNILFMGFRATLNFRKFKVALNPTYRILLNFVKSCIYPVYQNSIIRKKFTVPFLKYERLMLKLKVFLAGLLWSVIRLIFKMSSVTPYFLTF